MCVTGHDRLRKCSGSQKSSSKPDCCGRGGERKVLRGGRERLPRGSQLKYGKEPRQQRRGDEWRWAEFQTEGLVCVALFVNPTSTPAASQLLSVPSSCLLFKAFKVWLRSCTLELHLTTQLEATSLNLDLLSSYFCSSGPELLSEYARNDFLLPPSTCGSSTSRPGWRISLCWSFSSLSHPSGGAPQHPNTLS